MTTVQPCPWEARPAIDQSGGDWTLSSTRIRSVPIIMIIFWMHHPPYGFCCLQWEVRRCFPGIPLCLTDHATLAIFKNCLCLPTFLHELIGCRYNFTLRGVHWPLWLCRWMFSINLGISSHDFFWIIFFSPFSLSWLSATHVTHKLVSLCPIILWVSVCFLHSFLSTDCAASVNQLFSWFFG